MCDGFHHCVKCDDTSPCGNESSCHSPILSMCRVCTEKMGITEEQVRLIESLHVDGVPNANNPKIIAELIKDADQKGISASYCVQTLSMYGVDPNVMLQAVDLLQSQDYKWCN